MHEHFTIAIGSDLWWRGLIVASVFWMSIMILGLFLRKQNSEFKLTRILFWALLFREIFYHIWLLQSGNFTLQDSLPIHLCGISYFFLLLVFYNRSQIAFEFLLLLSVAGAIQSLITPELTHGYSSILYIDYYFVHAALLYLPMYCFFVMGMRLRPKSWLTSFMNGIIILVIVGGINYILKSNYIYLCEPPKAKNPFIIGGFPYHIIGFLSIGFLHILFIYFIFYHIIPKYGIPKKIQL